MTMPRAMPKGAATTPLSRVELVAMLAMLSATIAFSIDAMLPALDDIGRALSPEEPNRAQLVIAVFVFGMGCGTLFAGPLSDALGRRPVAVGGAVLYIVAALGGALTSSLTLLLVARFIQGIGAAGPRVVAMALVRDLFSGREMARILSFILMVFTLVPVLAPSMGAGIAWAFGWRAIFLSFAVFSFVSISWLLLRQPETLPADRRRPFRLSKIAEGVKEVFSNKQVVIAILIQTLVFSMLYIALLNSQPVFDITFGRGASFPFWFGLVAAISASASLINASIVVRLGMRSVVRFALLMQLAMVTVFLLSQTVVPLPPEVRFGVFVVWMISIFFMAGLGIGNLNAIALEPMGHMAGLAASIVAATSTIVSTIIAVPVGQAFDGTPLPMALGILGCTVGALLFFPLLER